MISNPMPVLLPPRPGAAYRPWRRLHRKALLLAGTAILMQLAGCGAVVHQMAQVRQILPGSQPERLQGLQHNEPRLPTPEVNAVTTVGVPPPLQAWTPPPPKPDPCAPTQYLALLADDGGTVGRVTVRSIKTPSAAASNLTEALQAVKMDTSAADCGVFKVTEKQVQSDFGAALKAAPRKPEVFLLYFNLGTTRLVASSRALLPVIVQRARLRKGADVSVIGHTDTQASAHSNDVLARRRANYVATELSRARLDVTAIEVDSYGESMLLIPTPDETPEPRNRRVEVTVR
jgi:outer membrane protein OmpA-like peptidoglycan-associated protein